MNLWGLIDDDEDELADLFHTFHDAKTYLRLLRRSARRLSKLQQLRAFGRAVRRRLRLL
jgi:hypothetical protein